MDDITFNQLTRNNAVLYQNRVIQVKSIYNKSINFIIKQGEDENTFIAEPGILKDDIEAIPLTTDILRKMGFRDYNPPRFTHKTNTDFFIQRIVNKFYLKHYDSGMIIDIKEVSYVHELQNIYLALFNVLLPLKRL